MRAALTSAEPAPNLKYVSCFVLQRSCAGSSSHRRGSLFFPAIPLYQNHSGIFPFCRSSMVHYETFCGFTSEPAQFIMKRALVV